MKRVVIADLRSTASNGTTVGHYFAVADNYCNVLGEKNVMVAGGPLYKKKYKQLVELPYNTYKTENPLLRWLKVLCNAKKLFNQCAEDIIVLQCSAVAASYMGTFLFKKRKTKLFLIQYNTLGLDSKLKKVLYSLVREKIDGVICPEEEIGKAYHDNYCIVPDYIYTEGQQERNLIDYDNKKYDFAMVGLICKDKGIIEAAQKLQGTKYHVVIAGFPQTEDIREQLEAISKECNNIEVVPKYLSEEAYAGYINNSKYCILNYSGAYSEHSSGVVFDVLFRGTPVVGRSCKSLDFIKEYNLGYIFMDINEWNPDSVFNKKKYKEYLTAISSYYKTHLNYQTKLRKFLNLGDTSNELSKMDI